MSGGPQGHFTVGWFAPTGQIATRMMAWKPDNGRACAHTRLKQARLVPTAELLALAHSCIFVYSAMATEIKYAEPEAVSACGLPLCSMPCAAHRLEIRQWWQRSVWNLTSWYLSRTLFQSVWIDEPFEEFGSQRPHISRQVSVAGARWPEGPGPSDVRPYK